MFVRDVSYLDNIIFNKRTIIKQQQKKAYAGKGQNLGAALFLHH